ncbi:hypothetical protein V1520DRAFT_358658, partial [Lipomyces starkeyi]
MGVWGSASIITKSPSHPNHLPWNPPKPSSTITSTAFFLESRRSSLNKRTVRIDEHPQQLPAVWRSIPSIPLNPSVEWKWT